MVLVVSVVEVVRLVVVPQVVMEEKFLEGWMVVVMEFVEDLGLASEVEMEFVEGLLVVLEGRQA